MEEGKLEGIVRKAHKSNKYGWILTRSGDVFVHCNDILIPKGYTYEDRPRALIYPSMRIYYRSIGLDREKPIVVQPSLHEESPAFELIVQAYKSDTDVVTLTHLFTGDFLAHMEDISGTDLVFMHRGFAYLMTTFHPRSFRPVHYEPLETFEGSYKYSPENGIGTVGDEEIEFHHSRVLNKDRLRIPESGKMHYSPSLDGKKVNFAIVLR